MDILKYKVIIDSIISNLTLLKKIIHEQQDPGRHGEYPLCKVSGCMAGVTPLKSPALINLETWPRGYKA